MSDQKHFAELRSHYKVTKTQMSGMEYTALVRAVKIKMNYGGIKQHKNPSRAQPDGSVKKGKSERFEIGNHSQFRL